MSRTGRRWRSGAVLLTLAVALPVSGGVREQARVSLLAQEATLQAVAEQLSDASGVDIAVDRALRFTRVSLQLNEVPLDLALDLLAEVAGLEVAPHGGGYLLRAPAGGDTAARPLTDTPRTVPVADRDLVKKVRLVCRHVAPSRVASVFGRPAFLEGGGGVTLTHPDPPSTTLSHIYLGHREAPATSRREAMIAEATERFGVRWSEGAHAGADDAEHVCHAALRVPSGVLGVLGFDPTSALIAVGEPNAVDAFCAMAAELDAPSRRIRIDTRCYVVPADRLAGLALPWTRTAVADGRAESRMAVVPTREATRILTPAAGDNVFAPASVVVGNAEPAAVACSQSFAFGGSVDDCTGVPATRLEAVDWVVATTDVKVVPWTIERGDERQIAMAIDPAFGDLVVSLTDGGRATVATRVPCTTTTVRLRPGESVVLGGIVPLGDYRSPDACPLLAQLPLVGALYRTPEAEGSTLAVVVVITPEPMAR